MFLYLKYILQNITGVVRVDAYRSVFQWKKKALTVQDFGDFHVRI
jgi:hypothetical protein